MRELIVGAAKIGTKIVIMGKEAQKGMDDLRKLYPDLIFYTVHFCAGQYKGWTGEEFLICIDASHMGKF